MREIPFFKRRERGSEITCFKAWCSGKAFRFPSSFIAKDTVRGISLYDGTAELGTFYFFREDYKKAKRIAINAVKKRLAMRGGKKC